MIYTTFLYYYIGPLILAVYLYASVVYVFPVLYSLKIKLNFSELLIFIGLIIVNLVKYYYSGFYEISLAARFYLGFIFFYIFFKEGKGINVDRLLLILACLTILETVLVNTIIPIDLMPNYLDSVGSAISHKTEFFGFYQRPYGFGANPSVTSPLLVALLALRTNTKSKCLLYISVLAIIISCSGSGYIALILYVFLRNKKHFICIALILIIVVYVDDSMSLLFSKISPEYLKFMYIYKLKEITIYFKTCTVFTFLFGSLYSDGVLSICSDFAMMGLLKTQGAIGTLLFLGLILKNINKYNCHAILIMIVSSIHYGMIFCLPGQLIFAYALTRSHFTEMGYKNKRLQRSLYEQQKDGILLSAPRS
jgi:hypothetical protein